MKKVVIAVLVLLVVGAAGVGGFFWMKGEKVRAFAAQPHDIGPAKPVDIRGGTGKAIAKQLAEAGVVSDETLLYEYLKKENLGSKLKAGEYEFAGKLTPKEVIAKIVSGTVKTYRFTVPEGLRSDEILPILAGSELKLDPAKLERLTTDRAFLKKAGVPANRIEGFLFPDTYTFTRGATEEQVLTKMIRRALEEYENANTQRQAGIKLSLMETFTLASIVEKETGAAVERPRISCVFHNRLRDDWKLQTDPTVLYAASLIRGTWVNNITRRDLETPHPYNTYTTRGLPPGPIANPGAEALKATLNPLKCGDYFFVSRNDGTHIFCPDLKCHEAAVDRWQKAYFRNKKKKTKG